MKTKDKMIFGNDEIITIFGRLWHLGILIICVILTFLVPQFSLYML